MLNKVHKPRWLQVEVQTIAKEIECSSISPKKYQLLSKKLDDTLEALQGFETRDKTADVFAKAQAEDLKEQVVKLYGDLEEGLVKREISQIKEESTSLRKGRLTLKAIKKLEVHIHTLEKNHLTSIPNRRIIADAKQALSEAKAKLAGKPIIHHFAALSQYPQVHFWEEIPLLPGDVEDLLDVARSVYNRDFREAKIGFATLPGAHKQRVENHLQHLMAKLFEDPLETMQALIATVNQLVENGEGYPTSSEIDKLFLGLK